MTGELKRGVLASALLAVALFQIVNASDAPAPSAAPAPVLVPLKDFAKPSEFNMVKISPEGEYLAATFDDGDQDELVTISSTSKKILTRQSVGKGFRISGLWWVGPKRVVFAIADKQGALELPVRTGELLAVNADGSAAKYLFGYRAAQSVGTHIQGAERRDAAATMINPRTDDPSVALISIEDFGRGDERGTVEFARLNVNSGAVNAIDTAPIPGSIEVLADNNGTPRYVVGEDDHGNSLTYVRQNGSKEWSNMNAGDLKKARIFPKALSADGTRAFLLSDEGGARACLTEQDLNTGKEKTLVCDPTAEITGIMMSFDRQEVIGANHGTATGGTQLLDTTHPDRERITRLLRSFPKQHIENVSTTRDGGLAVIRVSSDRNPGDYYLFNTKTLKAEYLASRRGWIDPDQMAGRHFVKAAARDGQTIHSVLTMPMQRSEKMLPLIVNPHGGPFGVYDDWFWDEEPQVLANRGYAVLQVNFRGSGGYGAAFENAGKQGWDSVMVNDITDATKALIAEGVVDPARICIFGGSYGGYAAMESAVREPDLYRCVVAYAGVYDLKLWRHDSDVSESTRGRSYISEFIGDDDRLSNASPINHLDQLKAPVLIVHGTADERVPITEARALRKAMDARKLPYEWLIKDQEGHGFFNPENRVELYTKMLDFIGKSIGPGAPVKTVAVDSTTAKP